MIRQSIGLQSISILVKKRVIRHLFPMYSLIHVFLKQMLNSLFLHLGFLLRNFLHFFRFWVRGLPLAQIFQQLLHLLHLRAQLRNIPLPLQHLLNSLSLSAPPGLHLLQDRRELQSHRVALQIVVRRGHQEQQLVVLVVLKQQLIEQIHRRLASVPLSSTNRSASTQLSSLSSSRSIFPANKRTS